MENTTDQRQQLNEVCCVELLILKEIPAELLWLHMRKPLLFVGELYCLPVMYQDITSCTFKQQPKIVDNLKFSGCAISENDIRYYLQDVDSFLPCFALTQDIFSKWFHACVKNMTCKGQFLVSPLLRGCPCWLRRCACGGTVAKNIVKQTLSTASH